MPADTPLGLLRELADLHPVVEVEGGDICGLCKTSAREGHPIAHREDCIWQRARTLLAEMPPERAETAPGGARGPSGVARAREALERAYNAIPMNSPVMQPVCEALAADAPNLPEAIDRAIAAAKQAGLWEGELKRALTDAHAALNLTARAQASPTAIVPGNGEPAT